jgi:hypothetical protein
MVFYPFNIFVSCCAVESGRMEERCCIMRVKLIPAQNIVALAFMTGDLCKGKKFVFRYQLRAEGEDNLLRLVQRDNAVEVCHCIEVFAQEA